ncbi:pyridoxamine 5'-phosphate oxidase family protein [Patiriisocius hiemis]|uniref:Pyridoxamine 5'-phosphate oxidase family protein n=1 Tax=Patiriisocius hiemis TaxID=3075604 RepID=A0ABU2YDA6_9FLAO|nr:pyridoxamine 5'-phosphate oxidase family protein [Constantimarinum sp. W242]MDT0556171.1 pyridoxamine 5'-phosphate oxidase family protein [Constantimarinum sp. W242]
MIKTLNNKEKMLLLSTNYIGSLGYIFQNRSFVVPITYFYNEEKHNIIGYSAMGHKVNAMRKNNVVSLSVTDIDLVNDWKSVLILGTYKEEEGSNARALLHQFSLGVKELILRKEMRELDFISQFSSKVYKDDIPIVFTISIEEITGRMRKF